MLTILALLLAVSIPTANFDLNRTNANLNESQLTPTSITSGNFKLLGSYSVDGVIWSQPLYVENINGRNLVIVATTNNSVYAFDANLPGTAAVWSNLNFATPVPNTIYPMVGGFPQLYNQPLGCLSTPVADEANLKLYVVCDTVVSSTPNWIIRQLDLTTGATLLSTTISGQVVGTGDPGGGDTTSGPNLLFFPKQQFQHTGLVLANNNVYVAFSSSTDTRPYHGWIMAYSTSALSQTAIFCTTPNGWGGAPWGSGGALAVDASGNIYATTGNGSDYDGSTSWTNTAIKFSSFLMILDWFEPSNWPSINPNNIDADMASNRITLIPGTAAAVVAGKDFNVYLLDTTCMGHLQGSSGCSLQQFKTNASGTPGPGSGSYGMVFLNNTLYLPTTAGSFYAFTFSGTFNTTPVLLANGYAGTNSQLAGSANGASTGILWVITSSTSSHIAVAQGVLRALNPVTLSEYWNSSTSGHDTLGNLTKFVAPVPVAGKVFVSTQDSKLQVFGLAPSGGMRGQAVLRGSGGLR